MCDRPESRRAKVVIDYLEMFPSLGGVSVLRAPAYSLFPDRDLTDEDLVYSCGFVHIIFFLVTKKILIGLPLVREY